MTVISFQIKPPRRFDEVAWTQALIQESTTQTGSYTTIDTIDFDPVDADPANPAEQDFTTELATVDRWYRVTFVDEDDNQSDPTDPFQQVAPTTVYADQAELARILKIRDPSAEQQAAMDRVLLAAAGEINSEIERTDLVGWERALAAQVNLDRAADLWRHTESIPGITGLLGDDSGAVIPGRYSWERYAQRLAPLKSTWGLA
jgi:hypothetical protein